MPEFNELKRFFLIARAFSRLPDKIQVNILAKFGTAIVGEEAARARRVALLRLLYNGITAEQIIKTVQSELRFLEKCSTEERKKNVRSKKKTR